VQELLAQEAAAEPATTSAKPNIALIGCGSRGQVIARQAMRWGKLVAVCDVDAKRAAAASKEFGDPQVFGDFRKLLERDDIAVIINGTPDHWHTLINIAAMKRGKDVYSEKPLTLTIDEGKQLVQVSRQTQRILQTGSQQRSEARFRLACELVRNGRLGKLKEVLVSLPAGAHDGPFKPAPVPEGLDWDFWQGQTPAHDYVPQRCHHSFRFWWDYSGGTMTDWGAHHVDIALWGMGMDRSGPVSVQGKSLVEPIPGGYTAASNYEVEYLYPNGVRQITRSTTSDGFDGTIKGEPKPGEMRHGVKFIGSDGWIFVTRGKIDASNPDLLKQELPASAERLYVSNNHMGNFFDCVRSRKQPICDAEIGHRAVSVCHLGNISMRLGGRKLQWDPVKEMFIGDEAAQAMVAREMRKPWSYDAV
jgi:predicted dehydrogenase